jgi:hypothetical protein
MTAPVDTSRRRAILELHGYRASDGRGGLSGHAQPALPGPGLPVSGGAAKQVRSDELESHFGKTGTLTMGGLLFVGPIVVLTLVLALTWLGDSGRSILLPTITMLVTAGLGAYDDRLSLVGSRGGGLSARAKFLALGGAALVLPSRCGTRRCWVSTICSCRVWCTRSRSVG